MKKRIVLTFTLAVGFLFAGAQQLPLYTQIYNNEFLYNPSFTLMEDYSSVTAFYRKQWTQIATAPVTRGVVFQTPLKSEKIGLGLNLVNDVNGMFARTGGYLTYAYNLRLSGDHHLLMGLTAGYLQTSIDFDETDDPIILSQQSQSPNALDATFGLGYKWNNLKVGAAVPHLFDELFNPLIASTDTSQIYFNRRHFLGSASYNFKFGTDFELKPTVLVRYTPNAAGMLIEGNMLFTYREKVWIAGNYRHGAFVGVGLGAIMSNRLNIGYSYDVTLGDFGPYGGATHELTVGLKLNKVKKGDFDQGVGVTPIEKQPWEEEINRLKRQVRELNEKLEEHSDSLGDHEERILKLEEQRDSLNKIIKEEIRKEIEKLPIGNASQDIRNLDNYPNGKNGANGTTGSGGDNSGGNGNYATYQNDIVNDDPGAPYGYTADGRPIGKNEQYTGKVYKDKNASVPLTNSNKSTNFYNEKGEKIENLSKYSGPVYNAENELVDYVKNAGKTGAFYRPYDKAELVNDGISYMAPGNYVVVGSFRGKENALKMLEELQAQGMDDAGIVYNNIRRWFYVYSTKTDDFDKSIDVAREYRSGSYPDAWIHIILSK